MIKFVGIPQPGYMDLRNIQNAIANVQACLLTNFPLLVARAHVMLQAAEKIFRNIKMLLQILSNDGIINFRVSFSRNYVHTVFSEYQ